MKSKHIDESVLYLTIVLTIVAVNTAMIDINYLPEFRSLLVATIVSVWLSVTFKCFVDVPRYFNTPTFNLRKFTFVNANEKPKKGKISISEFLSYFFLMFAIIFNFIVVIFKWFIPLIASLL